MTSWREQRKLQGSCRVMARITFIDPRQLLKSFERTRRIVSLRVAESFGKGETDRLPFAESKFKSGRARSEF